MTREEAIHFAVCLKNNWTINFADIEEFCDMAIGALTSEAVSRKDTVTLNSPISIQSDMVAVVRCKDCNHRYTDGEVTHYYWCKLHDRPVDDTDYCAWGEESEVEE